MRISPTRFPCRKRQRKNRSRGSIITFFLVIVAVVVTSLITSMAISSGTSTQTANMTLKRDQAFYAAESGVQHAAWKMKYDRWITKDGGYKTFTGTAGVATYTVEKVSTPQQCVAVIKSTGTVAVANGAPDISVVISCILTGDNGAGGGDLDPIPAISLGGSFHSGGTMDVYGTVHADGDLTKNGKLTMHDGDIYVSGIVDAKNNLNFVTGPSNTKTDLYGAHSNAAVPPPPNVIEIAEKLRNDPNSKTITSISPIKFNDAANKVIVYDQTTSPAIPKPWDVGGVQNDGTLVIFGDVTIGDAASLSNASKKVNLVVVGDLTLKSSAGSGFVLNGSLYVSGKLVAQPKFTVNGAIVCNSDMEIQANGVVKPPSATTDPVPDFDPRVKKPDDGDVTISNFTGPVF